jgi:4-carboxymuconolactone decarboxylase
MDGQQLSFDFGELSRKAVEWRTWYYDGAPRLNPVAEPVKDAFDLINATLFGHIYQRPALEGRIRSICTVAALIVLNRQEQLPGHITGALNYGWTKEQIVELITQLLFYGGYPCTASSLNTAAKTFAEYDKRHGVKTA